MRSNRYDYPFHTDYEPEHVPEEQAQDDSLTFDQVCVIVFVIIGICWALGEFILRF